MTAQITLPRGHVLLVDDADLALVSGRKWHAFPARDTFYAQAANEPNLTVHRLLMEPSAGVLVDHANRNGLDNRRSNLRLCNQSQNKANRPAPRNNTSGFKGVAQVRSGRWTAKITVDYRQRALGTFDTAWAWAAAEAYNAAALEAWGEFALLNQPPPTDPDAAARSSAPAADSSHHG